MKSEIGVSSHLLFDELPSCCGLNVPLVHADGLLLVVVVASAAAAVALSCNNKFGTSIVFYPYHY